MKEKEKSKVGDLVLQREARKGRLPGLRKREAEKGMREMGKQARNEQVNGGGRRKHRHDTEEKEKQRVKGQYRGGDKGEQNQTSAATSE